MESWRIFINREPVTNWLLIIRHKTHGWEENLRGLLKGKDFFFISKSKFLWVESLTRIRIRIGSHWFGSLGPDPHWNKKVDPDPHFNQCCGSRSVGSVCFSASRIRMYGSGSSNKNNKKNLIPTVLRLLYDFLY
jgi:hypothetical protein